MRVSLPGLLACSCTSGVPVSGSSTCSATAADGFRTKRELCITIDVVGEASIAYHKLRLPIAKAEREQPGKSASSYLGMLLRCIRTNKAASKASAKQSMLDWSTGFHCKHAEQDCHRKIGLNACKSWDKPDRFLPCGWSKLHDA